MKIRNKLTLGFGALALLVGIAGLVVTLYSKKALQEAIGDEAVSRSAALLDKIDRAIDSRIESLELFARQHNLAEEAAASNTAFAALTDIPRHIETTDRAWKAAEDTPFIKGVLTNALSRKLQFFLEQHREIYGYRVFSELYLANRHGVVIAASDRTSDYWQADEEWYQRAVEEPLVWVGEVEYDESSAAFASDIVIPLFDEQGSRVGIFKGVLNILEVTRIVEEAAEKSSLHTRDTKLITAHGKVLFSDEGNERFSFLPAEFLSKVDRALQGQRFFVTAGDVAGEGEELLAVAVSQGYRKYRGLGWVMVEEHEIKEIFAPVDTMQNYMLALMGAAFFVSFILAFVISRSVAGPLAVLAASTLDISKGNMDVQVNIQAKDEIGQLAATFNQMVSELRITTLSRDELRQILENMMICLVVVSPKGIVKRVNKTTCELLGYRQEELLGRPFERFLHGKEGGVTNPIGRGFCAVVEKNFLTKAGRKVPVIFSSTPLLKNDGRTQEIVCVAQDITERRRREEKLQKVSRALSAIHECNILLTQSSDEQCLLSRFCRSIVEQTGFSFAWIGYAEHNEEKGVKLAAKFGDDSGYLEWFKVSWANNTRGQGPVGTAIRTGTPCIVQDLATDPQFSLWRDEALNQGYRSVAALPLLEGKKAFGSLVIYASEPWAFDEEEFRLLGELATDLSYGIVSLRNQQKRQEAETQLLFHAFHDSLTGLPNRAKAAEALEQDLARARRFEGSVAVLLIDLNEFKLVNDTLGHEAGDELLCQVARRLRSKAREVDLVARHGGDEFILLVSSNVKSGASVSLQAPETQFVNDVSVIAQRLIKALKQPFVLHGQEVFTGASIGISLFPDDAKDVKTLMQHADSAMYRAKELGGGGYKFFSDDLSQRQQKRLALSNGMHQALKKEEFVLFYQPVVDLASGHLVGAEALIRWCRCGGDLVSPEDFLPLAEDTGLILPIGDWVLEQTCRQIRLWWEMGLTLQVAMNLSVRQFRQDDMVRKVQDAMAKYGIRKEMLELEITESAVIFDTEKTMAILRGIQEQGLSISLDDFGTGYSSLDRLKRLPLNKLKIDKSFVDGLPEEGNDVAIAAAIVQLAQNLGLEAQAEGIETEEQWRYLRSLGCQYGQGYYFSRPVPAAEMEAMALEERCWSLKA